jgi:aminoglycoside phosphotransferase (APT) family kinase protein
VTAAASHAAAPDLPGREHQQFLAGIQSLLARALDAGGLRVTSATRYLDGLSWETWHVVVSLPGGANGQYVVRRVPHSGLLDFYDVRQQWRLHRSLEGVPGVPVPRALVLDADGSATGRPLFVMEHVAGPVPTPQTFTALVPDQASRIRLVEQLAAVGAAIHATPVRELPDDLRGRQEPDLAAEIDLWERTYRRDRPSPIAILDWAFGWLARNRDRVSGRAALVHGDFRIGNFIVGPGDGIAAMLDWEGAHIGDPVEDLANCCMRLHGGGPGTVSGIISVEEFLAAYERSAGWRVPRDAFDYWRIFCDVRSAVVFVTAARRFEDGSTRDLRFAVLGQQLPMLLEHVVKDMSAITSPAVAQP